MDRPILFSGPMIRAHFDGLKTQTRRVLKPQPFSNVHPMEVNTIGDADAWEPVRFPISVGDRLWVREAWRSCSQMDGVKPIALSKFEPILYEADGFLREPSCLMIKPGKRRPSIHMPREFSRLTLTVTDVQVQRLQDISRGDAMAEGCPFPNMADGPSPRDWFRDLWDGLNAKRGFGWDQNPWVAAYSYTVHRCNIDQLDQQAA